LGKLAGQDIVKNIQIKLFKHLLSFRMKYFDLVPVGQLVTRSVSDIESIARIFSQGLFMIISDLMKMVVVLVSCLHELATDLDRCHADSGLYPNISAQKQVALRCAKPDFKHELLCTRKSYGNENLQLFHREDIEAEKFKTSTINIKAWIKTILYNSIFFPIADIISSLTLGFVVLYGGLQILNGETFTTLGFIFPLCS
jgi:ABC-type multidrug transport system fused ATPase/permease subunit